MEKGHRKFKKCSLLLQKANHLFIGLEPCQAYALARWYPDSDPKEWVVIVNI